MNVRSAVAAAGFAIAGYLAWLKWTGGAAAFCPRAAAGEGGWSLIYGVSKAGFHRIVHLVLPVPVGSRDRVTR